MRRLIAPAFVLFVLLAAGACNGTASTTPPGSPAPSVGATACRPTTDPVANPVAVSIADRTYDPDPVQATVGAAIEWHNEDGVPHTATLDDVDCTTVQLSPGQSGALVFTETGTFAYHCKIHSSMHGTITIAP